VRFRLDPKEADAPVEVPPPRGAAPAPRAPPPAAPGAPPAAAPSKWTRQRLLVVAVIALLLLGGGAGAVMYATNTGPFAYPHAYLVEGSSVPSGLRLTDLPPDVASQYNIESNPGEIPKEHLDDFGDASTRPSAAWIEVLGTRTRPDAITVLALQFPDAQHANTFRQTAQLRCAVGGAALLQDGDVVVLVIVGDSSALSYYQSVVSKILVQVSGVKRVCG
jgi:hypothetical protein